MIKILLQDDNTEARALVEFKLPDWSLDAVIDELKYAFPELQEQGEPELSPEAAIRRGRGKS